MSIARPTAFGGAAPDSWPLNDPAGTGTPAVGIADGRVDRLRIGLTGTNSRPFLLAGTDAFVGRRIDAGALADIDRLVQKQVQPMRTTLTSAHYRRLAAAALACRLVAKLSTGTAD